VNLNLQGRPSALEHSAGKSAAVAEVCAGKRGASPPAVALIRRHDTGHIS